MKRLLKSLFSIILCITLLPFMFTVASAEPITEPVYNQYLYARDDLPNGYFIGTYYFATANSLSRYAFPTIVEASMTIDTGIAHRYYKANATTWRNFISDDPNANIIDDIPEYLTLTHWNGLPIPGDNPPEPGKKMSEEDAIVLALKVLLADDNDEITVNLDVDGGKYLRDFIAEQLILDGEYSCSIDNILARNIDEAGIIVNENSNSSAFDHARFTITKIDDPAISASRYIRIKYIGGSVEVNSVNITNGTTATVGTPLETSVIMSDDMEAGDRVSYQWIISDAKDDGYSDIAGANSSEYTPVLDDIGRYIKVGVLTSSSAITVLSDPTEAVRPADPIELTITGAEAIDRAYDGTNTVKVTGGELVGVLDAFSDVRLIVAGATGTVDSKDVGDDKEAVVTGYDIAGKDADLYELKQPEGLTVSIAPAKLTATVKDEIITKGQPEPDEFIIDVTGFVNDEDSDTADGYIAPTAEVLNYLDVVGKYDIALSSGSALNYDFDYTGGTLIVTDRKVLTIEGITAVNRDYDGTTDVKLLGVDTKLVGVDFGDDVSLNVSNPKGTVVDKNAGLRKLVDVEGYEIAGSDADKYMLKLPTIEVDIAKKVLTVTALDEKIIENHDSPKYKIEVVGFVDGEDADTADYYTAPRANSPTYVDVPGDYSIEIISGKALNYDFDHIEGTLTVEERKKLDITGIRAENREYDGTIDVRISGGELDRTDIEPGDDVTLTNEFTLLGQMEDKNVGEGKKVEVNVDVCYGLDGEHAYKYKLTAPDYVTVDITEKELTIKDVEALDKIYDGSKDVSISLMSGGVLSGVVTVDGVEDDVVLDSSNVTGTMDNKNAGERKLVTVDGFALSGADAGNYCLADITDVTVNIEPKEVTVIDATAEVAGSRPYDGKTEVKVSGEKLEGVLTEDTVVLEAPFGKGGRMEDKHVGDNKPVTVGGFTLSGADAENYYLADITGVTVNITPKEVTVVGASATERVYDGTDIVKVSGGIVDGVEVDDDGVKDDVEVDDSRAKGTMSDINASFAPKEVAVTAYALKGQDAHNYKLSNDPIVAMVKINHATLTATAHDQVIKAEDEPDYGAYTITGFVSDDDVVDGVAEQPTLTFYGYEKDKAKNDDNYLILVSGGLSQNYKFEYKYGTLTVTDRNILTVGNITAVNRPYDGTTSVEVTGAKLMSGGAVYTNANLELMSQGAIGTIADKHVGNDKPVRFGEGYYYLEGTEADGFVLKQPTDVKVNITKAELTATADDKFIFVGDPQPDYTVTVTGFVNGENASTADLYSAPATVDCPDYKDEPGEYDIVVSDDGDARNYSFNPVNGKLTVADLPKGTGSSLITNKDDADEAGVTWDGKHLMTFDYTVGGTAITVTGVKVLKDGEPEEAAEVVYESSVLNINRGKNENVTEVIAASDIIGAAENAIAFADGTYRIVVSYEIGGVSKTLESDPIIVATGGADDEAIIAGSKDNALLNAMYENRKAAEAAIIALATNGTITEANIAWNAGNDPLAAEVTLNSGETVVFNFTNITDILKAIEEAEAAIAELEKYQSILTRYDYDDADEALMKVNKALEEYIRIVGSAVGLSNYDLFNKVTSEFEKWEPKRSMELTSETPVLRGGALTAGMINDLSKISEEPDGAYKVAAEFRLDVDYNGATITAKVTNASGEATDGIQLIRESAGTWTDDILKSEIKQDLKTTDKVEFYILPNRAGTYKVQLEAKLAAGISVKSSEYTVTVKDNVIEISDSVSNKTFNSDVRINADSDISVKDVIFNGVVTILGSGTVSFEGETRAARRVNINGAATVKTETTTQFGKFFVNADATLDLSGEIETITVGNATVQKLTVGGVASPTVIGDGVVKEVEIVPTAVPSLRTFGPRATPKVVGIIITTTVELITVIESETSIFTQVGNITIGGSNTSTTVNVASNTSVEQISLVDSANADINLQGSTSMVQTVTSTSSSSTQTTIGGDGSVSMIQQTQTSLTVSHTLKTEVKITYITETLDSLRILSEPSKTNYYVDDLLDLSGLVVQGTYRLETIAEGEAPKPAGSVTKISEEYSTTPVEGTSLKIDITEIKVFEEDISTGFNVQVQKIPVNLSFLSPEPKVVIYDDIEFDNPAITDALDELISYESNNTSVATVDDKGLARVEGVGTARIWAVSEENDKYLRAEEYYDITVHKKTLGISGIKVEFVPGYVVSEGTVKFAEDSKPTLTGVVRDDDVTLDFSGASVSLSDGDPNENHFVTISDYMFLGADVDNYELELPKLTVDSTKTLDKRTPVLDGSLTLSPSNTIVYGSELNQITISGSMKDPEDGTVVGGKFSWKNGTAKPNAGTITPEWIFTPSNTAQYNSVEGTAEVIVERKEVTVTGANVAESKVYDGSRNASITVVGSLQGVLESDVADVKLVAGSAQYDNKNVGASKSVKFNGYSISGSKAANYKLNVQPSDVSAAITQKTITVSGLSVQSKMFDGTDTAILVTPINPSFSALIGIDEGKVGLSEGQVKFINLNYGSKRAVEFTGFGLTGDEAGNYILEQPTGVTTSITRYVVPEDDITFPTASPVLAGEELKISILIGGSVVAPTESQPSGEAIEGTWKWVYDEEIVEETEFYEVIFSPKSSNYSSVKGDVEVPVAEAAVVTEVRISAENGINAVDETLTATLTATGTPSVTYKWMRSDAAGTDGQVIDGATEGTYLLTEDDAGKYIYAEITAVNGTLIQDGKDKSNIAYVNTDNDYHNFGEYSVTCNRIGGLTFVVVAYEEASPSTVIVNGEDAVQQDVTNEWRTVLYEEINAPDVTVVNQ